MYKGCKSKLSMVVEPRIVLNIVFLHNGWILKNVLLYRDKKRTNLRWPLKYRPCTKFENRIQRQRGILCFCLRRKHGHENWRNIHGISSAGQNSYCLFASAPLVITQKLPVLTLPKVVSRPEFAQDHTSGLRSDRGPAILCDFRSCDSKNHHTNF